MYSVSYIAEMMVRQVFLPKYNFRPNMGHTYSLEALWPYIGPISHVSASIFIFIHKSENDHIFKIRQVFLPISRKLYWQRVKC